MYCFWYRNNLQKYFDGELAPKKGAVLMRHVEKCDSCQNQLRAWEKVRHQMERQFQMQLRSEDMQQVWREVEDLIVRDRISISGHDRAPVSLVRMLRPALAACFCLFIGWMYVFGPLHPVQEELLKEIVGQAQVIEVSSTHPVIVAHTKQNWPVVWVVYQKTNNGILIEEGA